MATTPITASQSFTPVGGASGTTTASTAPNNLSFGNASSNVVYGAKVNPVPTSINFGAATPTTPATPTPTDSGSGTSGTTNTSGTSSNTTPTLDPQYIANPDWLRPGETAQQWHDRVQGTTTPPNTGTSGSGTGTGSGSSGLTTASTVTPVTGSSSFSAADGTPGGVTAALNNNIATYAQTGQQTQQELSDQKAMIAANLQMEQDQAAYASHAAALNTTGAPADIVAAGTNALSIAGNLKNINDTLAASAATQAYNADVLSRQVRTTVAQQVVQDQLSSAQFGVPYAQLTKDQQISLGATVFSATGDATLLDKALNGDTSTGSGTTGTGTSANSALNAANNGTTDASLTTGNTLGSNLSAYNPSSTYESSVQGNIAAMPTAMTTASSAQSYINSVAPNALVTGQMLMTAALQSPGVSPKTLAGIIQQESKFGTTGNISSSLNNVTGMKYAGQPGAMPGGAAPDGGQYAKYPSVQASVNDLASWLQNHPASQNATSPVGGEFSEAATAKVNAMPADYQKYVDAGAGGIAYLNSSKTNNLSSGQQLAIQQAAAAAGIPTGDSNDAAAVKSLMVTQDAINKARVLVSQTLGSGIMGAVGDVTASLLHDASFGNINPQLSGFNILQTEAIKSIQGLAGGAGSGLRITTSEVAAALNNFPAPTDTVANATAKLDALQSVLLDQLQTSFPYVTQSDLIAYGDGSASSLSTTPTPVPLNINNLPAGSYAPIQ